MNVLYCFCKLKRYNKAAKSIWSIVWEIEFQKEIDSLLNINPKTITETVIVEKEKNSLS